MRICKKIQKELLSVYLNGKEELGINLKNHIKNCMECKEFKDYLTVIDAISKDKRREIENEMEKVDWESFERAIFEKIKKEYHAQARSAPLSNLLSLKYLAPALTLLTISISLYLLRPYIPIFNKNRVSYSSELIFEKIEKVSAKNEIIKFLDESHLFLMNLKGKTPLDEENLSRKSEEMIFKKRYINNYLKEFPNAIELATKLDFIFMEYKKEKEEREEIHQLIEKENLILKIKLIKDELKEYRIL